MAGRPEIFVIDDDVTARDALTLILSPKGYEVSAFADEHSFLAAASLRCPACILLDLGMQARSGLDILKELTAQRYDVPIIMISGQGSIPTAVDAIRAGAFDFIEKPFNADAVVSRVCDAIAASAIPHEIESLTEFRDVLSPRECEVLEQILSGLSTRATALKLGISHRTIEVHRAHILVKLGARNPADLVRIVLKSKHRS
jgi:two-component system response regulator FixJ